MNASPKYAVAALAALLIATDAHAMRWYSPSTGRWFSRDPITEGGGRNIYGFVRNNPIQHVDKLGMFVSADPNDAWNILQAICPLCNGQRYNIFTSCCCKGKIVAKIPIETGIVTHKWTGPPGAVGAPVHY